MSNRQLVYRYFELPKVYQVRVWKDLGIYSENTPEVKFFQRASKEGKVDELKVIVTKYYNEVNNDRR